MLNGWLGTFLAGLRTLNQILTAGIAITAFSLFFYALSFNLRNRVARSFALILLCVVVVFTADALQDNSLPSFAVESLLRLQWLGVIFLPAAYLHLSDALLVTAGKPSRGRRRMAVRGVYLISAAFVLLLAFKLLVGNFVADGEPAPYLFRTVWTEVFTVYYIALIVWAGVNFIRAYRLMLTSSGRRRMVYLMAGATAPALGSYPFLLFGYDIAAAHPFLFWSVVVIINILVGALVVLMAYSVAFFGVAWPDRVIKSRMTKWLMRGPVTASFALGAMTIVRRAGELLGSPYSVFVPFVVVASILLMEHAITFVAPLWERWLFYGRDRGELLFLQNVEERLLTQSDLLQFLESILAAARDHLQAPAAFIAALDDDTLLPIVMAGNKVLLDEESLPSALDSVGGARHEFIWGDFWILPLHKRRSGEMDRDALSPLLGLLGVARKLDQTLEHDQREALWLLADRAAFALEDRQMQQNVFRSLADLQPQLEMIQRLRAAGRYDTRAALAESESSLQESDLAAWVKDALTHYWGGPKLTNNPLMNLQIVRDLAEQDGGNDANALRALLRKAVDQVKPHGERKFTTEWILYNILEMKFIEGRKVRDVAARLAMSESDLYRKQRVAVEEVAKVIFSMEEELQAK